MGNWVSAAAARARKARQRSEDIDRIIEEDSKVFKRECRVLLLGSRGSGKSTFAKQMKIVYRGGLSEAERFAYRITIYQNLLESAQALVSAMRELSIQPVDPQNRTIPEEIEDFELDLSSVDFDFRFPVQLASSINRLWRDPAIPQNMDHYHNSEFYPMDSANYFFTEAERIGSPNYVPNEKDILRCRQKATSGIVEMVFQGPPLPYTPPQPVLCATSASPPRKDSPAPLRMRMIEVELGGHHSELKKWLNHFEGVTSIVFCTALSDYDQASPEQPGQNRVAESLRLFESIVNSRWFLRASIILLMNKVDVFRDKVPKIPLERYCPEYTGGSDINKAAKFIILKFIQVNHARLSVYPHLTALTADPSATHMLFRAIKETIMQNALKASGIL